MTSNGNYEADIPEANEADLQEQALSVQEDEPDQEISPARPSNWEANEADLQEQQESINPDEDDDYPREEAE
jgi:hypothetical protein